MTERRRGLDRWLAALAGVLALGLVSAGVLAYHSDSAGLRALVIAALPDTRVHNPVTAVLLDLRGYDTLLEVAVLLLAWLAASASVGVSDPGTSPPVVGAVDMSVDRILGRLLLAPLLLVAAYLLWRGADAPGGAFQAGAVAAAAAVAWRLTGGARSSRIGRAARRLAPIALGVFLLVGAAVGAVTGTFLDYPPSAAREIMLGIEVATAGSVAYILAALFENVLADRDQAP